MEDYSPPYSSLSCLAGPSEVDPEVACDAVVVVVRSLGAGLAADAEVLACALGVQEGCLVADTHRVADPCCPWHWFKYGQESGVHRRHLVVTVFTIDFY